jgi:hypothetical protein
MPRVPDNAVQAAAEVLLRQYESEYSAPHLTWRDFTGPAREILEAAAPVLAEAVARKIQAHAGRQFPKSDPARVPGQPDRWRTWHRHFGIAARIAAGAFSTREDQLREAAQAIADGRYIACDLREDDLLWDGQARRRSSTR